ncbi:response regulator transcription factor [Actinoplanes sp. NBRC 103695]|uniref:helix-turn-helix transcriptional regulator n=1 Tax=Actinoplanes sp. NBRC 103695 TaxID=3032202 RepID=UPI0024A1AB7B|nr:response regulator transcription factor [Actinoplanes sp. NBRC 103695]GLY98104.1 helix-turn-helix transcriptional regulator [Actinoplanes sp. NBRC 103695]
MEKISVAVQSSDPLTRAGLLTHLQERPELGLLPADRWTEATVRVVATDRLRPESLAALRRSAAESSAPVVLIVEEVSEADLLTAVECRVVAVLPRSVVSGERLGRAIQAAATGGGVLPPALVGELIKHVERLQHEVLNPAGTGAGGLSNREIDVLRLMADGLDTNEIAGRLCYSERTVKNVIYGVTHRLNLRNRSHAVAYALRAGVI